MEDADLSRWKDISTNFSDVLLTDLRVETSLNRLILLREQGGIRFSSLKKPVIHFVIEGKMFLRTDHSDIDTELLAGDSLLVLYGDPHAITSSPGVVPVEAAVEPEPGPADEILVLEAGAGEKRSRSLTCVLELGYLSPAALINRAAANFTIIRRSRQNSGDDRCLTFDTDQVAACCRGTGATAFATMFASLQFVNFCRQSVKELWPNTRPRNRDPNARRITAALRKINTHLDKPWTLASLAMEVGLSRSLFAKEFVNCVGVSPYAYLTKMRMSRAANLLVRGSVTCREVASRVGYPIETSFCRAFKRYYGLSPRDFVDNHYRDNH